MPRPGKCRNVCCLPDSKYFGPLDFPVDKLNILNMTVDEYETIRLIDLKGFTQEECAKQMNISRTIVQGIYDMARKKLAESLVNRKVLLIEGGEYQICDERKTGCYRDGCRHYRCSSDSGEDIEDKNNLDKISREDSDEKVIPSDEQS